MEARERIAEAITLMKDELYLSDQAKADLIIKHLNDNDYQIVQWRPIGEAQKDGREITVRHDYGRVLTVVFECRYEEIGTGWYEGEDWYPLEEFTEYLHGLSGPKGEG